MKDSTLLILYIVALAVFFVILVILTIALLASRASSKKQNKKSKGKRKSSEDDEYEEHHEHHHEHHEHRKKHKEKEIDMPETRLEEANVSNDELTDEDFAFMDSAFVSDDEENDDENDDDLFGNTGIVEENDEQEDDEEGFDIVRDVKNTLGNILGDESSEDSIEDTIDDQINDINIEETAEFDDSSDLEESQYPEENEVVEETVQEEVDEEAALIGDIVVKEKTNDIKVETIEEVIETVEEEVVEETTEFVEEEAVEETTEFVEDEVAEYNSVATEEVDSNYDSDADEVPSDSAFAPEVDDEESGMTNEEIKASVKEAAALAAAATGKERIFGIGDKLKGKKKREKSTVASTEEFFWYNKYDVMEKPEYKTEEMYYHYFNIASDCIEDLLIEMYDCALVRTEEIRYIAYGIEPKAVSMKEILASSGSYSETKKIKNPTTQDMVKIYEKWCGYVDKLFDEVIEVHADEYTINEIRNQLYAFGRNDVEVLLEGK